MSQATTTVRKHLYLVTEHENEELVGNIIFADSRFSQPTKNNEGPIQVVDEEIRGFRTVGRKVHLGYYDFPSDDHASDPDYVVPVMHSKLREIDEEWIEKAGLEDSEWWDGDTKTTDRDNTLREIEGENQ